MKFSIFKYFIIVIQISSIIQGLFSFVLPGCSEHNIMTTDAQEITTCWRYAFYATEQRPESGTYAVHRLTKSEQNFSPTRSASGAARRWLLMVTDHMSSWYHRLALETSVHTKERLFIFLYNLLELDSVLPTFLDSLLHLNLARFIVYNVNLCTIGFGWFF